MKEFQELFGVEIRQGWGMTETSPLAALAQPARRGSIRGDALGAAQHRGRILCGRRGPHRRRRRTPCCPMMGKPVGEMEVRGPWVTGSYYRNVDDIEVPRRLAAHRETSAASTPRVHHTDRPREGRHQVGRRVDLLGRAGDSHHGRTPRARGRGRRGARRAVAGAATGGGRGQEGCRRHRARVAKFLCDRVVRWWLPERWTFIDEVPKTSVGKFDKKVIRVSIRRGGVRGCRVSR